jgi:hypothetical protein
MTKFPSRKGLASFSSSVIAASIMFSLAIAVPSSSADTPTITPLVLVAPSHLPSAPAMPFTGTTAPTFTIPATYSNLVVTPTSGVPGTPMTVSGSALAANTALTLTWSTANATWVADIQPTTANYMGDSYSKFNVVLATVTTDASGNFSYATTVPTDWGGTHDIYAVANGVAVGHAGALILRTMTVTPKHGPIGTPITITYTGLGASLYPGGAALLWDNHDTGELMAHWTRGTATAVIRAAGPVGIHVITVADAIGVQYLNIMQSPLPFADGFTSVFHTTKDDGRPASSITWPSVVTPTVTQVTTLGSVGLDPASTAVAAVAPPSGSVMSKANLSVTGLTMTGPATLVWSTVVGSRVNCSGTCWLTQPVALGTATVTNGILSAPITIPDGLGGWHAIKVMNGSLVEAQVAFYVKESIINFYNKDGSLASAGIERPDNAASAAAIATGGYHAAQVGIPTYRFKAGQEFTINLDGVGWTQFDNTLAVTYDNSFVGYGCGFNSSGYTVIHMHASGTPGTHIIDLYPMLYTNQPSFANTPYGMRPVLTFATDEPALALGYRVPSFHFAITIVK